MRFPTGPQDHGAWAPRAFIAQSYLRSYRRTCLSVYNFKEADEHRKDIRITALHSGDLQEYTS